MAAGSANAIDVGDAVFNFVADTQDLDLAMAKVDQTGAKLEESNILLDKSAGQWTLAGSTAAMAGEDALVAGTKFEAAADEASAGFRRATESIRTTEEAIGVRLPRGVNSFIAELPGISKAMELAFDASIVFFLISALVEGTRKLSDWAGATFIFTQAMRDADAAIRGVNIEVSKQAEAFDKAKQAYDLYGKTAGEITAGKIGDLTDEIAKNQKQIDSNADALYLYRNGLNETAVDVDKLSSEQVLLTAKNKAANEELLALQQQQTSEAVAEEEKRIAIRKTSAASQIEITRAEALLKLAIVGGNYSQELAITQAAEQQLYKVEVDSITQRISALSFEGDKTKLEREALYAQLEKLANDHNAKIYQSYANVMNTIRQQTKDLEVTTKEFSIDIADDLTRGLDQASAAAQKLGFTFSGDLELKILDTKKAYDQLKASGQATYSDLLQGQMKLIQAQILYDKQFGKDTKEEEKQLKTIQGEYNQLTGVVDKFSLHLRGPVSNSVRAFDQLLKQSGSEAVAWGGALGAAISDVEQAYASGSITIGKALEDVAAAQLKAIASIAEKKGTEQLAEAFGSYPDFGAMAHHFGAAALWFSLGGALSIGAGALSGGGSSGSSAASGAGGVPKDNSPATASQAQPTQVINVQRFAGGGLVTGPTLAVIGDSLSGGSAREAAIPLDHPEAIKAIVDAFQKAGGVGPQANITHITVRGMISPDNLKQVVKKINRQVNKGQVGLVASNTYRVTKRSQ